MVCELPHKKTSMNLYYGAELKFLEQGWLFLVVGCFFFTLFLSPVPVKTGRLLLKPVPVNLCMGFFIICFIITTLFLFFLSLHNVYFVKYTFLWYYTLLFPLSTILIKSWNLIFIAKPRKTKAFRAIAPSSVVFNKWLEHFQLG